MADNLVVGKEIHKSIRWNALATVSRGLSSFVTVVLLARWVAPHYFGATAVATGLTTFLLLIGQFGFSTIIISAKIQDKRTIDSLFWASMGLGGLIYLGLFVGGPYLESFYLIPELSKFLRVSGLSILIVSASSILTAILIRDLKYSTQGVQAVGSGLAIIVTTVFLGWYEHGPWTLLLPPMAGFLANLFMSIYQCDYRPGFQFDRIALRRVLGFGASALWSDLMNYVCTNLHVLVMGRRWITTDLGQYTMAYYRHSKVSELITYQYTGALYTILAEVREDKNRMRAVFTRMGDLGMRIIGPLHGIAIVLMGELVPRILGPSWTPAIPMLRMFCFIPIFRTLNWGANPVLYALGLPDLSARIASAKALSFVIAVGAAWWTHCSIYWMAFWTTFIESAFYVIYSIIALKRLEGSVSTYLWGIVPAMGQTLFASGIAALSLGLGGWTAIFLCTLYAGIYLVVNRKRFSVAGLS